MKQFQEDDLKEASLYPGTNELRSAILEALYCLGGTGTLERVREQLESKFSLTQEALDAKENTRPTQSLWKKHIRAAKQTLVSDDLLCATQEVGRDVWKLTAKGIDVCKAKVPYRLPLYTQPSEIFLSQGEEHIDDLDHQYDRYLEGARVLILVQRSERNLDARNACIEHYHPRCEVCEFDFEKVYGKIGEGFIHVHHLNPLQHVEQEESIDPIRDLIPLCPNCHSMAHRRTPPYNVAELRSFMMSQRVLRDASR